ncbi:MAG TPA: YchJ family protein [Solimonas sp.]|nr:YchJ family protein [Solimonas sp.]
MSQIPGPTCPCGSRAAYAACCAPFHQGDDRPRTAEALMRSRYSAYFAGLEDYLLETWHPRTRPPALDLDQEQPRMAWLGLKVLRHVPQDEDHAQVEFIARYRVGGGSAQKLQELSRFERLDGRWYYVDGSFPEADAGRNPAAAG